jgi:hypothetical protein
MIITIKVIYKLDNVKFEKDVFIYPNDFIEIKKFLPNKSKIISIQYISEPSLED